MSGFASHCGMEGRERDKGEGRERSKSARERKGEVGTRVEGAGGEVTRWRVQGER